MDNFVQDHNEAILNICLVLLILVLMSKVVGWIV